jgi:hypothetical protein
MATIGSTGTPAKPEPEPAATPSPVRPSDLSTATAEAEAFLQQIPDLSFMMSPTLVLPKLGNVDMHRSNSVTDAFADADLF